MLTSGEYKKIDLHIDKMTDKVSVVYSIVKNNRGLAKLEDFQKVFPAVDKIVKNAYKTHH